MPNHAYSGNANTMLTTFSTQLIKNGVRVSSRDVNARNAKRYSENGSRPTENAGEGVGDLDGVVRGECAAFEERDHDRSPEAEVDRGRGRDHDRGEPQPTRQLRPECGEVSSRGDDRELRCERRGE